MRRPSLPVVILLAAGLAAAPAATRAGRQETGFAKTLTVPGNAAWTDAGIQVRKGDVFRFAAEGTISLQRDNPVAECGPEGLDLQTPQQPVPGRNLGALVGRVLERVEVIEDKDSKEKIVRETAIAFFVGREAEVEMPADGRLFLGINENVTGDNDGAFTVRIVGASRT